MFQMYQIAGSYLDDFFLNFFKKSTAKDDHSTLMIAIRRLDMSFVLQ